MIKDEYHNKEFTKLYMMLLEHGLTLYDADNKIRDVQLVADDINNSNIDEKYKVALRVQMGEASDSLRKDVCNND